MTRQRAVERSALAAQHVPLLADALPWVGHFQIRNRGTIGGSLSHADPAAELPGRGPVPRRALHRPSGRRASGPRGRGLLPDPADHRARPDRAPDRGLVPRDPARLGLGLDRAGSPPRRLRARRHRCRRDARGRSDRGGAPRADRGGGPACPGARSRGAARGRSPHAGACWPTPPRRSAGRSTPAATSTRRRRTAATSPACSPGGRSGSRRRARRRASVPERRTSRPSRCACASTGASTRGRCRRGCSSPTSSATVWD